MDEPMIRGRLTTSINIGRYAGALPDDVRNFAVYVYCMDDGI